MYKFKKCNFYVKMFIIIEFTGLANFVWEVKQGKTITLLYLMSNLSDRLHLDVFRVLTMMTKILCDSDAFIPIVFDLCTM